MATRIDIQGNLVDEQGRILVPADQIGGGVLNGGNIVGDSAVGGNAVGGGLTAALAQQPNTFGGANPAPLDLTGGGALPPNPPGIAPQGGGGGLGSVLQGAASGATDALQPFTQPSVRKPANREVIAAALSGAGQGAQQAQKDEAKLQRIDAREKFSQDIALAKLSLQAMPPDSRTALQKDLASAGIKPGSKEWVSAILESHSKRGTRISFDADGNPIVELGVGGATANTKPLGRAQGALSKEAETQASLANAQRQLLFRAKELLSGDGIRTGLGAGVGLQVDRLAAALGDEEASLDASQMQDFISISKALGAEGLSAFGGSDSERELMVSLEQNPTEGKENTGNIQIINRKLLAIDILQKRPDFLSAWIAENGSQFSKNKDGQFFGEVWREFQRTEFGIGDSTLEAKKAQLRALKKELGGF